MRERWRECRIFGVWFDQEGNAIKTGGTGYQDLASNPRSEYPNHLRCTDEDWLSKPGGGCPNVKTFHIPAELLPASVAEPK
jgi:hypothetical protein